ncbi:MAG: GntP family permease, partial [Planctomycetaceae bacterium]
VPGLAASVAMFVAGMFWLGYRVRLAGQRGEGYGAVADVVSESAAEAGALPATAAAFAPILCVILSVFIMH